MTNSQKATRIVLKDFRTPPMRAFHMAWMAFFLSFFSWFGIAPLMAVVRDDLGLTQAQVGNSIIASVAITILVRMIVGPLCDRFGPRRTYSWLLIFGSLPVMGIGLSRSFTTFLIFRLAIGAIGASFVVTQFHSSTMFAPNVVGAANATTAGWGNLGGGVTQIVMPLLFAGIVSLGISEVAGWRLAMIVPGAVLFVMGVVYRFATADTPSGSREWVVHHADKGSMRRAARDPRAWVLFITYAACFGVELTINNIAALYYHDRFGLGLAAAGLVAGIFGLMNLFARALGGLFSDRIAVKGGLAGRTRFLTVVLAAEGVALLVFSRMSVLALAIVTMVVFSVFVQMAEGATFAVVPFVAPRALGAVSGIVAAGGNVGAVAAGFLFRGGFDYAQALGIIGITVCAAAGVTALIRFSPETVAEERRAFADAVGRQDEPVAASSVA